MKLFLPLFPRRKVQTFVDRAALEPRRKIFSPNSKVQSPSPPPFFNFFPRDIVERKRRQVRGERWGVTRTHSVKGRENCARWPFENTMEINLSSLTNLRGHKATGDRGIALIITRSGRGSPPRFRWFIKKERTKERKKNWDSVKKISTSRPAIGQRWSFSLWGERRAPLLRRIFSSLIKTTVVNHASIVNTRPVGYACFRQIRRGD